MQTRHIRIAPWLVCGLAVIAQCAAWAGSKVNFAQALDIIPTPKEMRLTKERFDLVREGKPEAIIVLAQKPSRQAEIGAEEINDAVASAAGVSLPVKTLDTLTPSERTTASLILVGQPGENQLLAKICAQRKLNLRADKPGPQGYQIRFVRDGKRRLALLAGCDPLGMLYACVTFRHLVRGEDKNAYAIEASIRDWPDVRWRHTWTRLQGKPITDAQQQIDWLLRHKVNVFFSYHAGKARHAIGDETRQPWYRELFRYAFERGLWGFTFPCHDNLGWRRTEQPDPQLDVCFTLKRSVIEYWCWSRDEMMERRFEEAAREVAANMPETPHTGRTAGIGGMFLILHMPDTSNMGWHHRCEQCRERFGNDQAAAQAHVFNRFYQAMRRHIPNSRMILVPRPYATFDLDAPKNQIYRDRITKIARLIPSDSFINHNGGARESVRSWKQAVGDRHLAHWGFGCGWRSAKTSYFEGRDDLFMYTGGYRISERALDILAAVEYIWNINAPGSTEVRLDPKRPYHLIKMGDEGDTPDDVGKQEAQWPNNVVDGISVYDSVMSPPERRWGREAMSFLERAARYLFGEQAAPYMVRAHGAESAGIGFQMFRYVPPLLSGWPYVPVTSDQMAAIVPVLEAGAESLDEVRREGIPLTGHQYLASAGKVLSLYLATSKARVWTPLLKAREAVDASQWALAAEALTEAEKALLTEADRLRAVYERYERPPQGALEDLRTLPQPEIKRLRGELKARQGVAPFPALPAKPRYQGGKMRVAIYQPPQGKGRVTGAQGIYQALAKDTDLQVAYIDNLKLETLLGYHCLIFPDCTQMPPEDFGRIADARRFVGEYGGGIYIQHNSVGHPRFPLRSSIFPEICEYADRLASNRVTVVKAHPIIAPHKVGETLTHMYYDHMTLDVQGREGTVILVDAETKAPVVVVGQVGQGRVVSDGSIALASPKTAAGKKLAAQLGKSADIDNFEYPAFGISAELLRNSVRWLCGK